METKELKREEKSREEQVQELAELIAKHKADAVEFAEQEKKLRLNLAAEEKILAGSVEDILNAVPDKSSKALLEDVLKMPVGKTEQLQNNIKKLSIARKNSERKAFLFTGAKTKIKNEIRQERIFDHVKLVHKEYKKWLEFYKVTLDHFHNGLLPVIAEGYALDKNFNEASEKLGLSKAVYISLTSHFKDYFLDSINMVETIRLIEDLGEMFGERLLPKMSGSTPTHPDDNVLHGFSEPTFND